MMDLLGELIRAGSEVICIVGKTHDFHVATALGISGDENLENIAESISHIVEKGREAIFDAEHFFDGYKSDPDYALRCLNAAYSAGASWVVLCDTNGGTLPRDYWLDHRSRAGERPPRQLRWHPHPQ